MEKSFTLIQTIATAGAFSAISFWYFQIPYFLPKSLTHSLSLSLSLRYGFMFGRESSRKELGELIESLRRGNSDSASSPPQS